MFDNTFILFIEFSFAISFNSAELKEKRSERREKRNPFLGYQRSNRRRDLNCIMMKRRE